MYFTVEIRRTAELALIDHYQAATELFIDMCDDFVDIYIKSGAKMLAVAQARRADPAPAYFLYPELFVAIRRTQERLAQRNEALVHRMSALAKRVMDQVAYWSPPEIRTAIDTTETLLADCESATQKLDQALFAAKESPKTRRASRLT